MKRGLLLRLALGCGSALMLAGCGDEAHNVDEPEEALCTFRGRYEYGFDPITMGCPVLAFETPDRDLAPVGCDLSGPGMRPEGITFDLSMTCVPADPVVECEGSADFSNGCSYSAYVRLLEP